MSITFIARNRGTSRHRLGDLRKASWLGGINEHNVTFAQRSAQKDLSLIHVISKLFELQPWWLHFHHNLLTCCHLLHIRLNDVPAMKWPASSVITVEGKLDNLSELGMLDRETDKRIWKRFISILETRSRDCSRFSFFFRELISWNECVFYLFSSVKIILAYIYQKRSKFHAKIRSALTF